MEMENKKAFSRRGFITATGAAAAGMLLTMPGGGLLAAGNSVQKKRLAIVGTGVRASKFWGKYVVENYSDVTEFVALCDTNPGRLETVKKSMGVNCPTFTNFDEMLNKVPIDLLFVTTVDATHDEFIVKALERNINVATEKPMTTDEVKCQRIITAERNSKAKLIMGFNYRYGRIFTQLKELLETKHIGEVTSVDFNWYLNTYHGADYFRRWHGERKHSGTLLLHKSSHHFDLLNWWIGSDPVEVHAYGNLEHYGKNSLFRGERCMTCPHKEKCKFFWDITKDKNLMNLYVENEKYDGYIRDKCLFRNDIDIFDKMAVQIKYANGVQVSYSLTTYSPYEGFRLAFNGKNGRMETWEGIPQMEQHLEDQSKLHEKEMDQSGVLSNTSQYHEIVTQLNFEKHEILKLPFLRGGHWGADKIMMDEMLKGVVEKPGLHHAASGRDGSMAVLIGIAARKSIDEGRAIQIAGLTDLIPKINKWG
jgi:predicted dehydrogenase